jgi:putative flippase GtrA
MALERSGSRQLGSFAIAGALGFLVDVAAGMLLNFIVYTLALALLPPAWWSPACAVACGSAAGPVVNFASAKLFVFKS